MKGDDNDDNKEIMKRTKTITMMMVKTATIIFKQVKLKCMSYPFEKYYQ